MIEKLLNNKEIAKQLGISINTWRNMRVEKPSPVMFAPNLYRMTDIAKWQEKRAKARA